MTAATTLKFLRSIIDDNMDYAVPTEQLINYLNEAQFKLIGDAIALGDERCLRTLYKITDNLQTGDTITNLFQHRSCRVYPPNIAIGYDYGDISAIAQYLEAPKYFNLAQEYVDSTQFDERAGMYYTIQRINNTDAKIFFNASDPDERAKLTYIEYPALFSETQALVVPKEYHCAIVLYAADLITMSDVSEQERGENAQGNFPIHTIGGL